MKSVVGYILVLVIVPVHIFAAVVNWSGNFGDIILPNITSQGQIREDSSTITLFLDGDAEISANNTVSGPAELSSATDILVTKYMLSFDGDGASATGADDTSYETYNSFISTPVTILYVASDGEVDVTLYVQASNYPDNVADSGAYTATQTLTVTWTGP
ncbi:MAG: hypothetical protein FVQ79_04480 [Planctomycetes bacterium]|nr:hypothetical protein [Planctomycetota bacterium]